MPTVAATALRRPVAAALVMVAASIPMILPAITGATSACAAATGPHAALVIDTGAGTHSFCVTLDATTVSGIHLIELAGTQDHLAYGFGSGGQAVCRLAGVGPQGDDCFADYPDYWGYWHGDGHGGWTWSSSGAASARIGDGALDAWVWGSGDSGTTHPKPPPAAIDDVCVPAAPTPAASPSPARSMPPAAPSSGARFSASPGRADPSTDATRSPNPSGEGIVMRSPSEGPPTAGALAAAPGSPPAGGGPGPGLLVAIVLGTALAGGGWLRSRSSRRGRSAG